MSDKFVIMVKSFPKCKPCEDIRQEVREIVRENPDVDIELIEFKLKPEEVNDPNNEVVKFFGEEHRTFAPIVIIESECKSKKITGYNRGDIKEAISEVSCDGEQREQEKEE